MTTILLIDDAKPDRMLLSRRMTDLLGCEVQEACDGEEGLAVLEADHEDAIDLVFVDMYMPGMNGLEFLAEVREQSARRNIPVVMLTGSKQEEILNEATRLGVNDFLIKPVDGKQIHQSITKVLSA